VRAAVDLDDDLALAAEEVGEVGPDRRLPHELEAAELAVAKLRPQLRLGRDRLRSQRASPARAPWLLTAHGRSSPWMVFSLLLPRSR
jgi:hypothetical protein